MKKLQLHSTNFVDRNIEKLADIFPDCITESVDESGSIRHAVDFDKLRLELGDAVVEGYSERYQLSWPGKAESLVSANRPIARTLRPVSSESIDFENTKNIFIEGDNLEALKLLQESYLNKINIIYIDPPYNTGNDFVYNDDFSEQASTYFQRTNQEDASGNRLIANKQSNGRFHSTWLSMIYPRLKLCRNLLSDDGVIFISIDDCEIDNLKKVCNEIFGPDNFVGTFIWKSRVSEDTRAISGMSTDHEYIVCYKSHGDFTLRGIEKDLDKFKNPDNDPRGPWRSADMTGLATKDKRPNLHYDLVDPASGRNYGCPAKGWRFEAKTMAERIKEGRILWPSSDDGRPRQKLFLKEMDSLFKNISSIIQDVSTADGTREVNDLLGDGIFDFPKPTKLIQKLVEQVSSSDAVVLDFFAGSGSTAEAVMKLNSVDGGKRRFILVQLPEPCSPESGAYRAGYKTIAEITKERIRRAKKNIKNTSGKSFTTDTGFRAFKIDSSNMTDIFYAPDDVQHDQMDLLVDNIKPDRGPEDLLFQVMLDWGVDLALPISKLVIQDKDVYLVDGNTLAACFDGRGGVDEDFVKELAKVQPLRVVFRDAGFKDSSVKINVEQIFKLLSPATEVKCI